MSGQASQLTRQEATRMQKAAECGNKSGATGNGSDPASPKLKQKGTKATPKSSKG